MRVSISFPSNIYSKLSFEAPISARSKSKFNRRFKRQQATYCVESIFMETTFENPSSLKLIINTAEQVLRFLCTGNIAVIICHTEYIRQKMWSDQDSIFASYQE